MYQGLILTLNDDLSISANNKNPNGIIIIIDTDQKPYLDFTIIVKF